MISAEKCIEVIDHILSEIKEKPVLLKDLEMHEIFQCMLHRVYGDFEFAMESVLEIPNICLGSIEKIDKAQFLMITLFGMEEATPESIPGFKNYEDFADLQSLRTKCNDC